MIKVSCIAKERRDGNISIQGRTEIEANKDLLSAEMFGILNELWKADNMEFIEAMDMFMEIRKHD